MYDFGFDHYSKNTKTEYVTCPYCHRSFDKEENHESYCGCNFETITKLKEKNLIGKLFEKFDCKTGRTEFFLVISIVRREEPFGGYIIRPEEKCSDLYVRHTTMAVDSTLEPSGYTLSSENARKYLAKQIQQFAEIIQSGEVSE